MKLYAVMLSCLYLGLSQAAYAGETEKPVAGQTLHDEKCIACHQSMTNNQPSTVYTRSDRKVKTYPALQARVKMCANNVGATWFDDEIEAVTQYLDTQYYHFNTDTKK